jgi:hypothetical protein
MSRKLYEYSSGSAHLLIKDPDVKREIKKLIDEGGGGSGGYDPSKVILDSNQNINEDFETIYQSASIAIDGGTISMRDGSGSGSTNLYGYNYISYNTSNGNAVSIYCNSIDTSSDVGVKYYFTVDGDGNGYADNQMLFHLRNGASGGPGDKDAFIVYGNGSISTNQPSAAGAGRWKLGKVVSATVTAVTNKYLEVMVDGVVYKLALAQ